MNVVTRNSPEETRARIVETADALFRRLGFAKTAVADIAGELGMSPANVYRFFPSKHAIVEAICTKCLAEIDENAWAVARARGSAAQRLDRLFQGIIKYHKENFIAEKRLHDIVLIAIEENWGAILAHKQTVRNAIELILRDGIESGEFEAIDPKETSWNPDARDDRLLPSGACRAEPRRRPRAGARRRRAAPLPSQSHHQTGLSHVNDQPRFRTP